jgi:hypothetical protein
VGRNVGANNVILGVKGRGAWQKEDRIFNGLKK